MTVKEIHKRLKEIEHEIFGKGRKGETFFGGGACVQIIHQEGTYLFYHNAFAIKEGEWWLIFTEHHSNMFYHEDEVKVRQYKRM